MGGGRAMATSHCVLSPSLRLGLVSRENPHCPTLPLHASRSPFELTLPLFSSNITLNTSNVISALAYDGSTVPIARHRDYFFTRLLLPAPLYDFWYYPHSGIGVHRTLEHSIELYRFPPDHHNTFGTVARVPPSFEHQDRPDRCLITFRRQEIRILNTRQVAATTPGHQEQKAPWRRLSRQPEAAVDLRMVLGGSKSVLSCTLRDTVLDYTQDYGLLSDGAYVVSRRLPVLSSIDVILAGPNNRILLRCGEPRVG
ncbi:hypothetical protein BDW22DRAFT_1423797 [Trametopsis cervina]|nr:hypothetical protein BDW22DRAFT_1423797 [Trametopsis cervina]